MPCTDITEIIKITLDRDQKLKSYRFSKKTCGGAVGYESMLQDHLAGSSVEHIISLDEHTFCEDNKPDNQIEEFLGLKHLFALQAALRVYAGIDPGSVGKSCALAEIGFDGADTVIDADINVNIITERIRACAHCGPG